MAKAYLGKISAIVTANTSDFNSKLNASAKEVRSFAASMDSTLKAASSSAQASLRGIYTESQKVSRALQAAATTRLKFEGYDKKTFAELGAAVEQFKRIQQAAVAVNEPLTRAAQTIDKLSARVQSAFEPAMASAQKSAEYLNAALARGGIVGEKSFERIRLKAEQAAQAANRLAEASQIASSGPRGTELAFQDPRLRDSLTASADLRRRAQNASAGVLGDGNVGRLVQQLRNLDEVAVSTRAEIESQKVLNVDTSTAERRLRDILETSRRTGSALESALSVEAIAAAEGQFSRRATPVGNLLRQRQQDEQRRRDEEIDASVGQFSRRATPVGNLLRQRQQEDQQRIDEDISTGQQALGRRIANGFLGILTPAEAAADTIEAGQQALGRRIANGFLGILTPEEAAADTIEAGQQALGRRIANGFLGILTPAEAAADTIEAGQQALGRRIANGFLTVIDPPEDEARRRMGGDIPGGGGPRGGQLETGRQVDNVINRVAALRQQIDSLPDSIRSQFIPSLQRATDEAAALGSRGFGATAAQIRNAANEARRLEQGVARAQRGQSFSSQFGGDGRQGVEFGLQEQSLRGYTAQLQILQQVLSGVSTTARGPATGAFDRLRTAISQAAADGTLDLRATRQEIERLTQEAVEASAGVAGINPAGLGRRLQRAGDVGRGAFGNLGLGIQQAVFAFDDFFSVTGGLDQRIRAAGNNISQLGFVLGGTQGLITGVAVSITAQLVVALIKWQNAGVGTEDRLKSLNDSLARQKSLVESLAQAFDGLGDSIGNLGFSKQAAESAKLQKSLDDLRSKFQESNEERLGGTDKEVQKQRGIIAARERELATTTDPGQRVLLQRQINDARRDEAGRLGEVTNQPALSPQAAVRAAADARLRIRTSEINARFNAANALGGPGGAASAGQREEARRREIAQAQQESAVFVDRLGGAVQQAGGANEQVVRARQVIEAQQLEIQQSITTGIDALFDTANAERRRQLAALEKAKNSLERGVIAAAQDLALDITEQSVRVAAQIGQSQDQVAQAIEEGVYGADLLGEVLNSLTTELQAAQERAAKAGIKGDLSGVSDAEREVATIQSLLSAREQEIAEIDATRVAVQNFNSVLDSFSSEADQIVAAARQEFDQAEAQSNARGTVADMRALEVARGNLDSAMAAQQAVREEVALERDQAQFGGSDQSRIQEAIAEIDQLLEYRDSLPFQQREELIRERESRRAEAASLDERAASGSGNALADAREQALRRESAKRGVALQESPAERAGRELDEQLGDLNNSLNNLPGFDPDKDDAMRQRIAQDAMRQAAPAIFGMADQVQNAVIQGPSRAALQASDVTTMQGASELNRLIRGDDSAKNVDTVELQKQSKSLERLVQIAEENGVPPGVFN